jgi:hypothetical protein
MWLLFLDNAVEIQQVQPLSLAAVPRWYGMSNLLWLATHSVAVAVTTATFATHSVAAETSVVSNMSAGYRYDDNINIATTNKIALSGLELDGSVALRYAASRWSSGATFKVGADRYQHLDLRSDDPELEEPKASDFDNETYSVFGDLRYDWERNTGTLSAGYSSDSTLNTQFTDTGLGGLRQIEGSSYKDTFVISAGWHSELTERQVLDAAISAQSVEFDSDRYVNYDYLSAQFTWSYILNERLRLNARPLYSHYENKADFAVTSETYGLEAGLLWVIDEKWTLDVLAGGTDVSTEYSSDGFFIFNPVLGQIEFVELEDASSNGFTGSLALTFKDEYYGVSANLDSSYSPSGNGFLQESNRARVTAYWKPRQRLRLDVDVLTGYNDTSGDSLKNKRTFSEAAIRVAYQISNEWWLSARYRYREQDYERNNQGQGRGNLVTVSVSYRLPKEIL